ncbi:TOS1 protein [Podospora didyma]|uniref:glucan endo-1,3-beta-D-glucosidase n=1 Tax=Podospora didyma TaxID=330526 RepID=A0AAE0P5Q8_9PEZI|nr:TOS1 protein [Podospora didyma]
MKKKHNDIDKMKTCILPALLASSAAAAAVGRASTSAELCAAKTSEENGNYFCQAVHQVTYSNVGFSQSAGFYEEVTHMDTKTGACTKQNKTFSGPMAPFNEPMSLHFRGPLRLTQLAVYMPNGQEKKREEAPSPRAAAPAGAIEHSEHNMHHLRDILKRRGGHHGHGHGKKRHAAEQQEEKKKRDDHPIIWVTATIDGKVVSWINNYWGPEATPAPAPAAVPAPAAPPVNVPAVPTPPAAAAAPKPTPAAAAAAAAPEVVEAAFVPGASSGSGSGDFVRTGYYNAAQGKSQGLTFLGNYGGQGSGEWTPVFGNTLSYINAAGTGGASSSTVLSDTLLPSHKEFAVMTDQPCSSSGSDCGYVQPGSVAYKGFAGADKTFLLEFSMPHDPSPPSGAGGYDMPAIWMLNARIPLTSQYTACSCWPSCGEFDIFETLAEGDTKAKSTFHAGNKKSGGDSNYFERPLGGTIRVAVVYDSKLATVSVKVLPKSLGAGDFPEELGDGELELLQADTGAAAAIGAASRFSLPVA